MEYQSELSQFLNTLKKANPELETKQQAGYNTWSNKPPLNVNERQRALDARKPQSAYVYYQNF